MSRTLLLNVEDHEEQRALLLEDGRASLYWLERSDEGSLVGNVYKARVLHIEPAIGAAFVDIGHERPGFLHADDVMPSFEPGEDALPPFVERSAPGEQRDIASLLARSQELLVQVTRDAILHKGPSLTTHVSLADRTAVLMPSLARVGVSRRVTDEAARDRVRGVVAALGLPEDLGIVVRTAGADADPAELAADVTRLVGELDDIRSRYGERSAPALLRQEGDFVTRALRDLLVRRIENGHGETVLIVDQEDAARRAEALFRDVPDRPEVRLHTSPVPLFHAHGVEREVRSLTGPTVALSGGASLVIQGTEALWAIDVNSGRLRRADNLEETARDTDLLAAVEVARQIRLRDLGGLIVVDFIDCRDEENRRAVEEGFQAELAKDPARMRVAAMSEFMVVEITRRRLRRGPSQTGSTVCASCGGRGRTPRPAAAGLAALRDVRALLAERAKSGVSVECARDVAADLAGRGRTLEALEARHGVPVRIVEREGLPCGAFQVSRLKR